MCPQMSEAKGYIKPTVFFKQNDQFKLLSSAINLCILIAKCRCSSLLKYEEVGVEE